MIIHGKDIRFRLTTGASGEIADLCPNRDINRIAEMLSGAFGDSVRVCDKFCVILNKWYVRAEKFAGRKADSLEEGEILVLDPAEYNQVMREAMSAFAGDSAQTVEVKATKKAEEGESN